MIQCVIPLSPYFLKHLCAPLDYFSGQIPHFCKFCRALVCLGATCSFFSISSCNILLLFVLRAFYIRTFDYNNCFSGVSEVLLDFFARFRVCIFCGKGKKHCVAPICACSFCFFCVLFYDCVQLRCWNLHIKSFAILNCPKLSLLYYLSDFFVSPKLTLFCCHVHALPNIALRSHLCMFLYCFAPSPC